MSKDKPTGFEIAPLRSLNDFLLESAKFQIPTVDDWDKWGNRVVHNLLYYQSNYFLVSLLIFMVVGLMHPVKMFSGILVTLVCFALFCFITNEKRAASQFKKNHPILSVVFILASIYIIAHVFGSLLVFALGIFLPITVIFIHASLRTRNFKNKMVNKIEILGIKKTPMGLFLDQLDIEPEFL